MAQKQLFFPIPGVISLVVLIPRVRITTPPVQWNITNNSAKAAQSTMPINLLREMFTAAQI